MKVRLKVEDHTATRGGYIQLSSLSSFLTIVTQKPLSWVSLFPGLRLHNPFTKMLLKVIFNYLSNYLTSGFNPPVQQNK
jgi:hypothetical protein